MHREFDQWDPDSRGYLTSDDVRNDEWLSKNFERCNVSRTGRLTREEYNNCPE